MKFLQTLINLIYGFSADKFYRKFDKDTKNAEKINKQVLQEILRLNAATAYGQIYQFYGLRPEDYKKQVPLTYYQDYEGFIDEIAAGKENVLTSDPIIYFGLSSGTTGKQKRIPVTRRSRKIVTMAMMLLQHGLLRQTLPSSRKGGRGLLLMNMLQSSNSPAGIPTGAGTSGGVQSMRKALPYFWTTPMEVLALPDQKEANYLHLLFALKDRDLAYIMAPFASGVIQLLGVLEERYQELVEDIKKGSISSKLNLAPEIRAGLEARVAPDPQRARELECAYQRGMAQIVPRIWPKISHVSCVAGGSFSVYEPKLKFYTGQLPIYSAVYGATESLIGLSPRVNEPTYVLVPRAAYFEFIKAEEIDAVKPVTLNLNEVTVGETYEIVITNYAGFYRYRLGDIVKVVDFYHESPVLEFLYRKGQLLNIAGEKTSEEAVRLAITHTMETLKQRIVDFSVTLDISSAVGNYAFYLEIESGGVKSEELSQLCDTLE
ncbi:MAG: GH3 auxin-responsive promoter family protein, partial [Bacillota bacterium]|nr:GH3 auxin-responsive promoter family protein [Bacillota bacterium]